MAIKDTCNAVRFSRKHDAVPGPDTQSAGARHTERGRDRLQASGTRLAGPATGWVAHGLSP